MFKDRFEISGRTGSYGSSRATIDINQQLIDKVLAVRVDGLWKDEKYQQKPAFENDKRVYGTIRFDPQLFRSRSFHTSVKANWEHGEINANRPRTITPNDSITSFFNSTIVNASNPFGGMGRTLINNPYDLWRTDNITTSNNRGTGAVGSSTYLAWLSDMCNQQQPYWMYDGTTNHLYGVNGGFINTGARTSSGGYTSASDGILGKRRNAMFVGLTNLVGAVTNYNLANSSLFTDAKYGQYRTRSLLDPSIFDFYKTLIDGPTKKEWERWNAYSIDITQTGWNDRVGLQFSYDRQKYQNGSQSLLGGNPTLNIDILQNFPDYYASGNSNVNVGRPFVSGAGNNGGSSTSTDREYRRLSLFAELRASDLIKSPFFVKLLGRHRFNAVASDEKFFQENRSWQLYANSQSWAGYWNGTDGSSSAFTDRPPLAYIYLGSSISGRSSAAGAHIPGITANIQLSDAGIYVFDPSWKNNTGVNYSDTWSVPSSLYTVFNGLPNAESTTQLYAVSNPSNMVGWTTYYDQLMRYNDGSDLSLLTKAQKSLRETISYAGSYQGYLWNDAFVPTLGWRYDQVKTKDCTAQQLSLQRSILNMNPDVYTI